MASFFLKTYFTGVVLYGLYSKTEGGIQCAEEFHQFEKSTPKTPMIKYSTKMVYFGIPDEKYTIQLRTGVRSLTLESLSKEDPYMIQKTEIKNETDAFIHGALITPTVFSSIFWPSFIYLRFK